MKYLFFSGAPDTGKSTTVYNLTTYLINDCDYKMKEINNCRKYKYPKEKDFDFTCILEKGDTKILVHSITDTEYYINQLHEQIQSSNFDAVISTIRDNVDEMREYMTRILNIEFIDDTNAINKFDYFIEIPLAKITRRFDKHDLALEWYNKKIKKLTISIISTQPFNLL